MLEWSDDLNWKVLEGRVLVHGEEENGRDAGRGCYLMLEGRTPASIMLFTHPSWMRRGTGVELRTNSFVRLEGTCTCGAPSIETEDMGDAESILRNKGYRHETGGSW